MTGTRVVRGVHRVPDVLTAGEFQSAAGEIRNAKGEIVQVDWEGAGVSPETEPTK